MNNIRERFDASGYLEVWKVYDDGTKELHFSDHNVITSGMGVGLAYLFAGSGSDNILDYQIRWFQVGLDQGVLDPSTYVLASALSSVDSYGTSADIITSLHNQIKNGNSADTEAFAFIPYHHVHKVGANSVRYTLVLNKDSANGLNGPIEEVGLFMNNPKGGTPLKSILVAYRTFTGVQKTSEFALIFKWSISF